MRIGRPIRMDVSCDVNITFKLQGVKENLITYVADNVFVQVIRKRQS